MLKFNINQQKINIKNQKLSTKHKLLLKFRIYNIQGSFMNYVNF